jgi:hypothetical protein
MKTLMAVMLTASLSALAQDPALGEMKKHWGISKTFTLAVADAMPDATYSFKATPEEMSFGEMVVHIATATDFIAPAARGARPNRPS